MTVYRLTRLSAVAALGCLLAGSALAQAANAQRPAVPLPDLSPKPESEEEQIPSLGSILETFEREQTPTVKARKEAEESEFPEITLPGKETSRDQDLRLFESWLAKDKKPEEQDKKEEPAVAKEEAAEKPPEPAAIKKPPAAKNPNAAISQQPFSYKSPRLPPAIYRDAYGKQNEHLPRAVYEEDYDAQAFAAVERDDVTVLRAFLETGRSPEMETPQGEPLLLYAVRQRALSAVRLLLGRGSDPNRISPGGGTALHYAVANRDYEMAEALLAGGAEPRLSDRNGVSALDMAEELRQPDILAAMRRAMERRGTQLLSSAE